MNEKSDAFKSDFVKVDATSGVPDEELPEVTDEMLDRAVFSVGDRVLPTPKRRGRPVNSGNKTSTTARFSNDVLTYFKATGKSWQTCTWTTPCVNGLRLKLHPPHRHSR